jgi:hypothetical protein
MRMQSASNRSLPAIFEKQGDLAKMQGRARRDHVKTAANPIAWMASPYAKQGGAGKAISLQQGSISRVQGTGMGSRRRSPARSPPSVRVPLERTPRSRRPRKPPLPHSSKAVRDGRNGFLCAGWAVRTMAWPPHPRRPTQMRRPRPRSRCSGAASVHRRCLEGALQGDPAQPPTHTPIQQITPSKDSVIPPRCISRAAFSLVMSMN